MVTTGVHVGSVWMSAYLQFFMSAWSTRSLRMTTEYDCACVECFLLSGFHSKNTTATHLCCLQLSVYVSALEYIRAICNTFFFWWIITAHSCDFRSCLQNLSHFSVQCLLFLHAALPPFYPDNPALTYSKSLHLSPRGQKWTPVDLHTTK